MFSTRIATLTGLRVARLKLRNPLSFGFQGEQVLADRSQLSKERINTNIGPRLTPRPFSFSFSFSFSARIYPRATPSSCNSTLMPFLFFVPDFHPRKSRFSVALPVVKKSF